jgi:hypothetical protein
MSSTSYPSGEIHISLAKRRQVNFVTKIQYSSQYTIFSWLLKRDVKPSASSNGFSGKQMEK